MTDLHELLDRACAGDDSTPDLLASDLRRGRLALRRRRSVRAASTLAGVAAVGALGYAVVPRSDSSGSTTAHEPSTSPTPSATPSAKGDDDPAAKPIVLARSAVATPYFRFGVLPKGWELFNQDKSAVEITPGGRDTGDDGWEGDLVVMLDADEIHTGTEVVHDGRTFWVNHRPASEGMDTVYVATRDGEPGWGLEVQYPQSAGFTDQQMIKFAASVEVRDGAVPSAG